MQNKKDFIYRFYWGLLFFPLIAQADVSLTLLGGPHFNTLANRSLVAITPLTSNLYQAYHHEQTTGMVGVSLGYTFENPGTYEISYRASGYSINLNKVRGIEYPFFNQGIFDTLNYRFKPSSSAVLFEPQLSYKEYIWQPFALIGVGLARNQLKNFNDWPSNPAASAASSYLKFPNHTSTEFAYELGLGIQRVFKLLKPNMQVSGGISYRYFNLGEAELRHMSGGRIFLGSVDTQALLFQLTVSFS